jgi:hypothetical protein
MEPYDFLILLAKTLGGLQIGYRVTGSIASIAYGEFRFTNDIDVVVDLGRDQVEAFCAAFPAPDFCVSRDAALDAEDVILKKLEYYQEGGSEKHLRDIAGVLKIQGDKIDRQYVAEWAGRLGVAEVWELVVQRVENG